MNKINRKWIDCLKHVKNMLNLTHLFQLCTNFDKLELVKANCIYNKQTSPGEEYQCDKVWKFYFHPLKLHLGENGWIVCRYEHVIRSHGCELLYGTSVHVLRHISALRKIVVEIPVCTRNKIGIARESKIEPGSGRMHSVQFVQSPVRTSSIDRP